MKENLFEMGADFSDSWSSDNKEEKKKKVIVDIKIPREHQLHFSMEKRQGKIVTIVKSFCLEKKDLQTLVKVLKKKLGTGGTIKEDNLEFQGEVKEQLIRQLKKLNYGLK